MSAEHAGAPAAAGRLPRQLGLAGAVALGMASMLGTGIFAGLALALDISGPWTPLAVLLAAGLAACNGLSSAALAAAHPVSGGTYEYGYRWLHPLAGFAAGWLFLLAKSASAAAAALASATYILALGGADPAWRIPLAAGLVGAAAALVLLGLRRSTQATLLMLAGSILALLAFVVCGAATWAAQPGRTGPGAALDPAGLLQSAALLFVAYTGYGRIATLGEEVIEPRRTIPRAILLSIALSAVLYLGVSIVAAGALDPAVFAASLSADGAPLAAASRSLAWPGLPALVSLGAISAMLGVLLNLLLGLSRVALAMARRGDLPAGLARVDEREAAPALAFSAAGVLLLVCLGSLKAAWSFSAFTVLAYYALTNLAALRLPPAARLAPPAVAWAGLLACLALACCIEWQAALAGCLLLLLGGGWFWLRTPARLRQAAATSEPRGEA